MKKRLFMFAALAVTMVLLCSCTSNEAKTSQQAADTIELYNFTLIDGTGAEAVKDKVILIKDGVIYKITEDKDTAIPAGCRKIDLKGFTLLPGFINTHVHNAYSEQKLQEWLASGVTTVRDLSPWNSDGYTSKRDEFNKNADNARLVSANPILTVPGGYGHLYVDSPEEARKTVNELADNRVDIIKIALEDDLQGRTWAMLSPEMVNAIVETAHGKNKRVSAHISHVRNVQLAIDAGVDELAHMVVERLDDNLITQLVKKDIYFIPTLELWQGVSNAYGLDWEITAAENLARFYKAGGKISFGTDYAGYTTPFDEGFPITEAKLMNEAGIPNMGIIVSATQNAAFACGLEKELGTIEEGKTADILVVEGNPLEDINALTETRMVIHAGEIIKSIDTGSK